MAWEVNSPEAARDVGVAADAAGGKSDTVELTGGSLREGMSTLFASTVVSRGGSFRGGESILPANSNSGSNSTSSPIIQDGDGDTGHGDTGHGDTGHGDTGHGDTVENTASGYAKLSAERLKGYAKTAEELGMAR